MKRLLMLGLLLLTSGFSYATSFTPMTSDIQLESSTAAPKQVASISLSQLVSGVPYDITCLMASNGKSQQDFDGVYSNIGSLLLDGQQQYSLMKLPAKGKAVMDGVDLKITRLIAGDYSNLKFTNLDDTDTISIYNCVAKVHYNN